MVGVKDGIFFVHTRSVSRTSTLVQTQFITWANLLWTVVDTALYFCLMRVILGMI